MISMNCLGSIGRLGNQMFQYAALKSISKKFNYKYCLPVINTRLSNEDLNLYDCFELDNEQKEYTQFYKIELETLGFDENIFDKCPDNVDLQGYFQDIRYFIDNERDIKKAFKFKKIHYDIASNYFYSAFSKDEEVISIHIRRGDYFHFPHNIVQSIQYYVKSLMFFNKNLKVLIFSDDIDWASQQDIFKNNSRFYFSRYNNSAVDLCMQTFCNYHIIANSTFSWWGAWLADSKKVIKPKKWFNPPLDHYDNFLHVDGWISI